MVHIKKIFKKKKKRQRFIVFSCKPHVWVGGASVTLHSESRTQTPSLFKAPWSKHS